MSDAPLLPPETEAPSAETAPREPWARRLARLAAGAALLALLYGGGTFASLNFFMRRAKAVEAPDVRGMDLEAARARALSLGLDAVESRREPSEGVLEGVVVSQSPEPGFPVKPGQSVFVVVSAGASLTQTPDLTGLPLASAQESLRQSRLALKTLYRVTPPAGQAERDIVLAQEPPPGTEAAPGAGVTLVVAGEAAAAEYLAPHLTGMPLAEAKRAMERGGFSVRVSERAAASPAERGVVTAQYPLGGTLFRRGDAVTLTVGQ